ncbi:MAG: hypothetical protein IKY70_08185, partial [Bacteroidales bacterium]|nr:hypothetical protein [Bacteroidales bacterium]
MNIKILSLVLFFALCSKNLFAQLPSSGDWTSKSITTDTEVVLEGNINLKGGINVKSGTLTIKNNSNETYTILNSNNKSYNMFTIQEGGRLVIEGNEAGKIIIDGGAEFTWEEQDTRPFMKLTPGTEMKVACGIRNLGSLKLKYVTIQNINDSNSNGGAIHVVSSRKSELDYCVIQKCRSTLGSAIIVNRAVGDPDTSAIIITNSTITKCISGGDYSDDNPGGTIRTFGSVVGNLILKKSTFSYNYSMREYSSYDNTLPNDGNGGALFWNGRGNHNTRCEIDGCIFEYNKCDDNGGAIKSQGTLNFVGEKTIIRNNYAPNGAGLYIEGYTGSVTTGIRTISYDLSDKLVIENNISESYDYNNENIPGKGAGIHFFFGDGMTLAAGSTIDVNLNGAIIRNNKIEGDGGLGAGIYFENTSIPAKQYVFNISLDHGTVQNNISTDKGGGIYIFKGNVTSRGDESNQLIITGNTAYNSGSGLYIQEGNLDMTGGEISSNSTLSSNGYGGG